MWLSDAKARLTPVTKTEPGVELIEVSYDNGSFAYLLYPIQPSAVIDDLRASIRIRSAQSGLRVGFRIVFPRSTDPATRDSLVEVILGNPSEGGGRWSTCTINNVVHHYENRVRFLRAKYGPNVDLRDAYVDGVVLSVYSPRGTIRLQVDDLQVDGMIAPSESVPIRNTDTPIDLSEIPVDEQLRNLQATVPRWIQYQGESLDYLKSLGFTAIITNRPNDSLVIEQSLRTQMGVIAPPPDTVPTGNLSDSYRHVQGWLLGMALDQSHLEQTRSRVSKLTRFPQSLSRPTIGEAMEMYGSYSRLSDWLAVPTPIATRVRSAQEARQVIQSDLRPMAGRSIPLTSIVTQMPLEWIAQKNIAYQTLSGETTQTADYDLLQTRLQVYRSMMQGTRGWIFRSGAPLDSGDPTSLIRSQGYTGINQEIELFLPWIRAGQSSWRPIEVDSREHVASLLETPNSQLAIVIAAGPMDQICSPAPNTERIQVTLPFSGQVRNTFRITHGTLERLRPQQTPKGHVVVLERPALVEQIVSVVDLKPVSYLQEQLTQVAPHLVESRMEIAEQVLEVAQKTLVAQAVPTGDDRWEQRDQAKQAYRDATYHLAKSNIPMALKSADEALLIAQRLVRRSWEEAAAQFNAFQSSPLVSSPLSLPLHFEFSRLLADRPWQPIQIPDTPFRTNESFAQSRWRVDRRLTDTVQSDCYIGETGPDGQPCLLLSTQPLQDQPIASGYAGAAMRVTSPPIEAPIGSIVHIQGLVRIDSPPNESQSGLLVCDNLGGETLGQLISSVDPSEFAWRRFGLVRFVSHADGVRLHLETRGQMRAAVSDLKVDMIIPRARPGIPIRTIQNDEVSVVSPSTIPTIPSDARIIRQPN
jgi:hypothetical protein